MHKRFLSYIKKEDLFSVRDNVLIAVSGGMDSITLAEMMRINQFNFAIAHFNHVTRDGESDLDEEFVRSYAKKYKIAFYSTTKDINQIIESENGGNFQNLARLHRYDWLEDIRKKEGFDYIATAHHHNDQIETFLFHFSRGTGLDGLTGIDSKLGRLVRPMLVFTRTEIETYVFNNKIEYRVDSSNSNSKYSRNYIRHGIIPSFKILNDHFESNANTTIENLRSAKALYDHLISKFLADALRYDGENGYILDTAVFSASTQIDRQLCFELIRGFGFNFHQVSQLMDSLEQRGKLFYSDDYVLLIEKGRFLIKRSKKIKEVDKKVLDTCSIKGLGSLKISKISQNEIVPGNKNIEYIDADKVTLPLQIRNRKDGDRFKPLGMKGRTKKLKDFFTDIKLNRFAKDNALVILNKDKIVWVIGHRLSENYKITLNTKNILKLEWFPESED